MCFPPILANPQNPLRDGGKLIGYFSLINVHLINKNLYLDSSLPRTPPKTNIRTPSVFSLPCNLLVDVRFYVVNRYL